MNISRPLLQRLLGAWGAGELPGFRSLLPMTLHTLLRLRPALLHTLVIISCWLEAGQEPRHFLYMGKEENKVISPKPWKPPRTPELFCRALFLQSLRGTAGLQTPG